MDEHKTNPHALLKFIIGKSVKNWNGVNPPEGKKKESIFGTGVAGR
jgi:hypothetical protein